MPKQLASKRQPDSTRQHYSAPLVELLSLGEPTDATDYATYAAQLGDCVPDLIRMVLDDDLNERDAKDPAVWAPLHALRVLVRLAPAEAAESLLAGLDLDDEWFGEELPKAYGQIGAVAIPLLTAYLKDPVHQRFARDRASGALCAIAEAQPRARAEVIELLTHFLDRPNADASADEEAVTTSVINDLADLKAITAYGAICRAYEQDRVDPQVLTLNDVERAFGMRPPIDWDARRQPRQEPGVRLVLRCKACGREREQIFPKVYYDQATALNKEKSARYNPLVIPQPVTCPKCGTVDQYELGGMGNMVIMANLLATAKPAAVDFLREDQRIQFIAFTTRWGPMHPQEAIERYQKELALRPNDVTLHVGFGNIYKLLGRDEQAAAKYQTALSLAPHTTDAWVGLAQLAVRRRDQAAAIQCWEQVKVFADQSDLPLEEQFLLVKSAEDNLADLRDGLFPEYEPMPTHVPEVAPRAPYKAAGTQPKVGRNEPCPCGSGKKYKHCHGR